MSEQTVSLLVETIGNALLACDRMVVVAESCTGGGIARAMTDRAGSSRWFERGFITYSNSSKMEMLGVTALTLENLGAVSEFTAIEMARGALLNSHAHISVAVTGIAGPDGGTEQKPVGMVCFAWADEHNLSSTTLQFEGDRVAIREQSVLMAIQGLINFIDQHVS